MSRKETADAKPAHGFADVIGLALLAAALLLAVAEISFHAHDLSFIKTPPDRPAHNWIGVFGAHLAHGFFFVFGAGAYALPLLMALFGLSCLLGWPAHLRQRWAWSGGWAVVLAVTLSGILHLAGLAGWFANLRAHLNVPSVGGWLGWVLYEYGFWMLGDAGAAIVYGVLYLISLMFLTDFHPAAWLAERKARREETAAGLSPEERELARKARELEKQRKELEERVKPEGLGVDGRPVPEPLVRDLSVPQSQAGEPATGSKRPAVTGATTEPRPIEPADEGEIIPAREVRRATTGEILGRAAPPGEKPGAAEPPPADAKKPVEPAPSAPASVPGSASNAAVPPPPATAAAPAPPAPRISDQSGAVRKPARRKPIAVAATPQIGDYRLPPLDLLNLPDTTIKPTESKEELMANARLMQQTLAQFEITVTPGDITKGPTFTRYELHPAPGVKLERITALTNNLAAALKAERIHILAPVPGKGSVGIEVPNPVKTKVIMRDLLEAEEWRNAKARIPVALGKDVYGHPIIQDLAEMPHLLIAGSTGSGKSVCINAIIASLLYRFSPDQLRFVMIDPKVVELQQYNILPHLVVPVVNDPKKVILALRWVVNEMEKRYQIFAKVGVRNIKSFNERPKGRALPKTEPELPLMARKEKVEAGAEGFAVELDEEIVVPREEDIVIPDKLSYIVVIIDELADLMLVAPADVEMAIARITQMARAAGIHCIVATQRPSVDVITGVIKANIPARIAFQVASRVDSRTILDAMGADKLLGKGDMLYLPPGSAKLIRAQGALITDQEINGIVEFIAQQAKPSYELEIHQQLSKPANGFSEEDGSGADEELIEQCIEVIRSEQKASTSLLQRRLRIGYGRAARIMDILEERGIVGPSKGAEPRDILMDLDGGGADGGDSAGDEGLAQR